jgi:copper(I)-binding protein
MSPAFRLASALALPSLALVACGDPVLRRVASHAVTHGDLTVHTLYALPPFTDSPMPVYFSVRNAGTELDLLEQATSPASDSVLLHGSGSMEQAPALVVPAGGELRLEPGGQHLMLVPPVPRFARGDSVQVTLRFARAGAVTVWVMVVGYEDVPL